MKKLLKSGAKKLNHEKDEKLICSYCLKSFSPQGFPIHVLYHKSHGDRKRLAPPKYGRVKIRNTNANAVIEEVLAIDVEEVQQDIDVASYVVEGEIATEPNVNDVSLDVIEEEAAVSDVEDGTGDDV